MKWDDPALRRVPLIEEARAVWPDWEVVHVDVTPVWYAASDVDLTLVLEKDGAYIVLEMCACYDIDRAWTDHKIMTIFEAEPVHKTALEACSAYYLACDKPICEAINAYEKARLVKLEDVGTKPASE